MHFRDKGGVIFIELDSDSSAHSLEDQYSINSKETNLVVILRRSRLPYSSSVFNNVDRIVDEASHQKLYQPTPPILHHLCGEGNLGLIVMRGDFITTHRYKPQIQTWCC
jgi:hypothetical protein